LESAAPHARGRPRLKRLRFLAILFAALLLGLVSFVFGMFMAVASDLPSLTRFSEYKDARNSVLLDDQGRMLGVISKQNQILLTPEQIPTLVKNAVIAIEDKRFRSSSGIDPRAIARAFFQDILHKQAVQGASTIEQQFVKNALQAQAHRTIFEKLREAALAFHLAHRWSKEKILTEYLNTIYFGNGAYGVESAARTYFGQDVNHLGCGTPSNLCVTHLEPWEAALLAGVIQNPSAYDPVTHPAAAKARRDTVLRQLYLQGYLPRAVYEESVAQALPAPKDVQPPHQRLVQGIDVGYFTSWVRQQVIERYGATLAFDGGLRVRTTLDLDLQRAAEQAINNYLPGPEGPGAALVAIDNATGEVRAMVGGRDYNKTPFNLATEGERQPGSSFKAFDLAAALEQGISPESTWASKVKIFPVPHSAEKFVVHNDENAYSGSNTLTGATAFSDNSIFAEVGLDVGTRKIARIAHRMGIRTPISTNPAMTIGGLKIGVTPLDMAHAYETLAHGGELVSGTLSGPRAPVGVEEVDGGLRTLPDGAHRDVDRPVAERVLPGGVASTETSMLETVLQYGTGRAAAIGQFAAGKTGTTSNYGDAWFVGWDSRYTVAVWVGYPTKLTPMKTEFNGGPVLGGTFPALVWHDFMTAALGIDKTRAEQAAGKASAHRQGAQKGGSSGGETVAAPYPAAPAPKHAPEAGGGAKGAGPREGPPQGTPHAAPERSPPQQAPAQPAPASPPTPTPAPSPARPPASSAPSGGGAQGSAPATGGVSPGG
jgi:penicillin-binding protein 1A